MSRAKSKQSFSRIGAGLTETGKPQPERSFRALVIAAWVLCIGGAAYGVHKLEPTARGLAPFNTHLEWVDLPAWLEDKSWHWVLDDLAAVPAFGRDTDIYDANLCGYIAQHLSGSPWIDQLKRVAKLNDGRVRVHATFRKPFTLVENNGWAYLIDESGVRLPVERRTNEIDYASWLTISGATTPIPPVGERWDGKDIEAGIKLVRYLLRANAAGELPIRTALRAVDVSNFDGRRNSWDGRLKILTNKPQSYIHWGYPPGEEYTTEACPEKKLAALNAVAGSRRWLDGQGWIDIRAGSWADRPQQDRATTELERSP